MITKNKRGSVFMELVEIDSTAKEGNFAEATEWFNGEGYDIVLSSSLGDRIFQLSYTELRAIKILTESI
jgi:hypothetical protein